MDVAARLHAPLAVRHPKGATGRQARLRRWQELLQLRAAAREQQDPVGIFTFPYHPLGRQMRQQCPMLAAVIEHGQGRGIFHVHFVNGGFVGHGRS
ncbi:hypothetical protein D3C81_1924580 [compost metagenome]